MVFTRARTSTIRDQDKESQDTNPDPSLAKIRRQDMAEEENIIPQQARNLVETRKMLLDGINSKGASGKTTINIELGREVTFKPDNTMISSLPFFIVDLVRTLMIFKMTII